MAYEDERRETLEAAWKWWCRGLASAIMVVLLVSDGLNAPVGLYLLLLGLFFGPEVLAGQIAINRKSGKRDEER